MKRCQKCITPDSYPRTFLNQEGICNHCIDYEKTYSDWNDTKINRKKQFEELINIAKKRSNQYDVLVPLSGGKDSTYVLHLATQKYNLKTLCYNFDNGFQSEIAKKNIKKAIDASGADLFIFKPNEELLTKLYKHFLKQVGLFCPVCMRGICTAQFTIAHQFSIPLVLKGSSKRTEENLVPEIFQDGRLSFFKNVLRKHPIGENIAPFYLDRNFTEKLSRAIYLLSNGKFLWGTIDVHVPDFFEWNYNEIYQTISNQMGWKALPDRDEHVDCLADPVVHYLRRFRCSDLTPNTLRYSAEIRSGQIDREEAIQLVKKELNDGINKNHIEYFIRKLNISIEELDSYMVNNHRHMAFQKEGMIMSVFQKALRVLRKRH